MSVPCLDGLRPSLEGVVASVIATCDADGLPNVSMISQVHYVDPDRVALSYQFFNKTRRNLLATRRASVQIVDPETMQHHRLALAYEDTLTSGPLFESMKAKLSGIASHHGMDGVFRLLGADVFRVLSVEAVPGPTIPRRVRCWRPPGAPATRSTPAPISKSFWTARPKCWRRSSASGTPWCSWSRTGRTGSMPWPRAAIAVRAWGPRCRSAKA